MIDTDRLNELRDEVGADDLAEVVALFCDEVEEVLGLLDGAPPDAAPSHLHFLKGSALNIGFSRVSALCRDQEDLMRADASVVPDVGRIRAAYNESKRRLLDMI